MIFNVWFEPFDSNVALLHQSTSKPWLMATDRKLYHRTFNYPFPQSFSAGPGLGLALDTA